MLIDEAYESRYGLFEAVERRLREEFARLGVEINEEKSRQIDVARGESFGFLGFDFRRVRTRQGRWRPHYTPKLKKRTALMGALKEVFRRYRSQPVARVVEIINHDTTWVGELFRRGSFQQMFPDDQTLGGIENQAPSDESKETKRLRLDEVEYAAALRESQAV